MLPVAVNVPAVGSYNSAVFQTGLCSQLGGVAPHPPATSTFPVFNRVAVCE